MNLKSHFIFTLYTIYGILLKGEPGTSAAYVRVCVCARARYVCLRAHVAGQQQGRVTHAGPGRKVRSSHSHVHVCLCACACVRALNVRKRA